jgi:hypothetical protein
MAFGTAKVQQAALATRSWVLAETGRTVAAITAALLIAAVATTLMVRFNNKLFECDDLIRDLQLAGTPERVNDAVENCPTDTSAEVQVSLHWDFLFAAVYGLSLAGALFVLSGQAWRMKDSQRVGRFAAFGALVAAVLDVVENGALRFVADEERPRGIGQWDWDLGLPPWDGNLEWSRVSLAVAAAAAWTKFALLIFAVLVIVLLLLGCFGYSGKAPDDNLVNFAAPDNSEGNDDVGIALSGGGMRSATFALGVLRGLDGGELFRPARWLAAVSGGAYTAGAWYVARFDDADHARARAKDDLLTSPGACEHAADGTPSLYSYLREYRHYMSAGRGGLLLPVLKLVSFLLVNLAVLYAVVWLLARPVGWLVSSDPVAPQLRDGVSKAEASDLTDDLLTSAMPVVAVPAVMAVLFAVASLFFWRSWHARLVRCALGLLAVAVGLTLLLIVVPLALWKLPEVWREVANPLPGGPDKNTATSQGAGLLQVLSSLGVVGAIAAALRKPALRIAPRAGGFFLALVVILVAGQIATNAARVGPARSPSDAVFFDPIADLLALAQAELPDKLLSWDWSESAEWLGWLLLATTMTLFAIAANQRWWSLHAIYKRGLRNTFNATTSSEDAPRDCPATHGYYPLSSAKRPWNELRHVPGTGHGAERTGTGPELLVCAAVHGTDSAISGVPAASFVFSSSAIGWYEPGPDGRAVTVCPQQFVDALPGWLWFRGSQGTVSSAVATTGAAVASALGRHSLGTTHSLLAVFNLRLGVWLPNPARIDPRDASPEEFATPKLTYLLKEIFGRYSPYDDPYVYVADGGHWENLGLVELIRRRCKTIFCADASGDAPYSFTALQNAIDLARAECGVEVEINLVELRPGPGELLPATNVAVGKVRGGPDGYTADLIFGRLQVATDSSAEVRNYCAVDRRFPRYATFSLFLRRQQFEHMVLLGEEVAAKMVAAADRERFEELDRRSAAGCGSADTDLPEYSGGA